MDALGHKSYEIIEIVLGRKVYLSEPYKDASASFLPGFRRLSGLADPRRIWEAQKWSVRATKACQTDELAPVKRAKYYQVALSSALVEHVHDTVDTCPSALHFCAEVPYSTRSIPALDSPC